MWNRSKIGIVCFLCCRQLCLSGFYFSSRFTQLCVSPNLSNRQYKIRGMSSYQSVSDEVDIRSVQSFVCLGLVSPKCWQSLCFTIVCCTANSDCAMGSSTRPLKLMRSCVNDGEKLGAHTQERRKQQPGRTRYIRIYKSTVKPQHSTLRSLFSCRTRQGTKNKQSKEHEQKYKYKAKNKNKKINKAKTKKNCLLYIITLNRTDKTRERQGFAAAASP